MTEPNEPIKVLCVDDSPDIAMLLHRTINAENDMQSVGCVCDADAAIRELGRCGSAVVVLDYNIPGMDPVQTIQRIVGDFPSARVLVHSGHDDPNTIDRVLDAGAWGFVSKHGDMSRLVHAIRQVAAGKFAV